MSNDNVKNFSEHAARKNRAQRGPMQRVIGEVGTVTELKHLNAVAFTVRSGADEMLFWMSLEAESRDPDYRRPLEGESVKIWFNSTAQSLEVAGEKAIGIVEIRNMSGESERRIPELSSKNDDGPSSP